MSAVIWNYLKNYKEKIGLENFLNLRTKDILNSFLYKEVDEEFVCRDVAEKYWKIIQERSTFCGAYFSAQMLSAFQNLNIEINLKNFFKYKVDISNYVLQNYPTARKQTAKTIEHVVPSDIAAKYLIWISKNFPENLESSIRELLKEAPLCFVLFEEDQKLKELKLNKTMPNGIEDLVNKNWWARYEKANIEVFPISF